MLGGQPQKTPARLALVVVALAIVYVVWGSTYLAIKFAVAAVPPLMMAGVRFLIAGAILLPIVWLRSKDRVTPRQWGGAALIGCLLLIGGNGPVCYATQFTPSGVVALVVATAPLWFAMLDWLIFRGPRPTARVSLGLLVGLVGVCLLLDPGRASEKALTAAGALVLTAACFFWSFGSLLARRVPMPSSAFVATGIEMLVAGAVLVILSFATGESARLDLSKLDLRAVLAVVYLIVAGSLVGFTAYVWLLGNVAPGIVSTYAYVNPMIAVLLGTLLGNEPLSIQILGGAALIIAAVVLMTFKRSSTPNTNTATAAAQVTAEESG